MEQPDHLSTEAGPDWHTGKDVEKVGGHLLIDSWIGSSGLNTHHIHRFLFLFRGFTGDISQSSLFLFSYISPSS